MSADFHVYLRIACLMLTLTSVTACYSPGKPLPPALGEAMAWTEEAETAFRTGRYSAAQQGYKKALDLHIAANNTPGIIRNLVNLAVVATCTRLEPNLFACSLVFGTRRKLRPAPRLGSHAGPGIFPERASLPDHLRFPIRDHRLGHAGLFPRGSPAPKGRRFHLVKDFAGHFGRDAPDLGEADQGAKRRGDDEAAEPGETDQRGEDARREVKGRGE